jgi:glycosyltransferase involved in cell wall biosynthesis
MSALVEQSTDLLGIWSYDPTRRPSACTYYRVEVPLRMLTRMGLGESWCSTQRDSQIESFQALAHSDIGLFYGTSGDEDGLPSRTVESIRMMHSGMTPDGRRAYPPSLVYDLDDNIDYVHPFNPAFSRLGTRSGSGDLLHPGDNITTVMPDGKELPVWLDMETVDPDGVVFDISRNRARVNSCHATARACHGVTVPSEMLAKYYRDVHKCPRVYVFPNTVVEDDYWFPNLAKRDDGKVRILWQGGQSHMGDWWPLRDALREVAAKYPQAVFVIWGTQYPWIHNVVPEAQIEYHEWLEYSAYKIKRHGLDCDINLAPLTNNVFNRCKSAIKWYEASIGPRPEATLASGIAPYVPEIKDGETGLIYRTPEEFAQKLGTLIENAELRRKLAENARTWVRANRTPEATIPGLYDFYQELRAVRRMEHLAER